MLAFSAMQWTSMTPVQRRDQSFIYDEANFLVGYRPIPQEFECPECGQIRETLYPSPLSDEEVCSTCWRADVSVLSYFNEMEQRDHYNLYNVGGLW